MDTPSVVFAGDGHGHWHVRDLETYTLHRLDTGATAGYGATGRTAAVPVRRRGLRRRDLDDAGDGPVGRVG